jgi:hypothetical protein
MFFGRTLVCDPPVETARRNSVPAIPEIELQKKHFHPEIKANGLPHSENVMFVYSVFPKKQCLSVFEHA